MKLIIKLCLFLCIIILAYQCKQSETQQIAEDHSYLIGTYRWNNPLGKYTPNQDQNNSIVLQQSGNAMEGFYYGTTDEFDQAREGYYPGYFVLKMDSLIIRGDSIWFVLKPAKADFFEKPIDISIRSTQEAKEKGYTHWGNFDYYPFRPQKVFAGVVIDSARLYFGPDDTGLSAKGFLKISD